MSTGGCSIRGSMHRYLKYRPILHSAEDQAEVKGEGGFSRMRRRRAVACKRFSGLGI